MSEETGTYLKSWGSRRVDIRGSQGAGTFGEARGVGGALISFPIHGCPEWRLRPLEFPFLVSVQSQSACPITLVVHTLPHPWGHAPAAPQTCLQCGGPRASWELPLPALCSCLLLVSWFLFLLSGSFFACIEDQQGARYSVSHEDQLAKTAFPMMGYFSIKVPHRPPGEELNPGVGSVAKAVQTSDEAASDIP